VDFDTIVDEGLKSRLDSFKTNKIVNHITYVRLEGDTNGMIIVFIDNGGYAIVQRKWFMNEYNIPVGVRSGTIVI
jgi:hypothetical protein